MNRTLLQSILKAVSAAEPADDAVLLEAYRSRKDESAFSQLTARYARLVWHVCRNLTRCDADAEDAFQATFLVLARNAGKIAKPERLGSWLHGVACRVCSKARREAGRRNKRERAAANGEASNGVTDSKWDRALAAVHEELANLPDIYRVPFVLCCLEGRGTTEAAQQLGWKLGTLSGRLTRAKNLLIARLESRGIAASAVAAAAFTVGTTNAPAAIVANVSSIASGTTVPGSILYLSQGVIGMSVHRIKLLAAAIMLTGSLGMGLGTTWLANAQDLPKANVPQPETHKNQDLPMPNVPQPERSWNYDYIPVPGLGLTPDGLEKQIEQMEKGGWMFLGQVAMQVVLNPKIGKIETAPTLVFRRPTNQIKAVQPSGLSGDVTQNQAPMDFNATLDRALNQLDLREARIAILEAEITKLKNQIVKENVGLSIAPNDVPIGLAEMKDILARIASKNGYPISSMQIVEMPGGSPSTLQIIGPPETIEWATKLVQTMSGKTEPAQAVKPRRHS